MPHTPGSGPHAPIPGDSFTGNQFDWMKALSDSDLADIAIFGGPDGDAAKKILAARGEGGGASGDLIPATDGQGNIIPGKFINPNTGAVVTVGTGSNGPTRVGVQAPDPFGAAVIRADHYDRLVERGELTGEAAADEWQREFDEITANRDIAAEKFAGLQRLQDTATRRGELEFDILKSSLPVGKSLNLGPFGVVPENRVNIQELLSQGLPPLRTQFQNVSEELTPITGLPEVAPLELPDRSLLAPLLALANKTAAGSSGFLV